MKELLIFLAVVIFSSNVFGQKLTLYENYEAYKTDKYKFYEEIDEFHTKSTFNESIDSNYYRVYYKFDIGGIKNYYTYMVRLHKGREYNDQIITILDNPEETFFWGFFNILRGSGYRIIVYREDKGELLTSSTPFSVR
jgi:hypothetical protein